MTRRFLLDVPAQDAGLQFDEAGERRLTLRYRDANGATIGEEEAPRPPTVRIETSDGQGRLGWQSATLPIELDADVPDGTAAIELLSDGEVIGRSEPLLSELDAPPPPAESRQIHGSGGWRLRIISERFASAQRFFEASADLVQAMRTARPFDRAGTRWQVSAHFWPSSGPGGLFQTFDPPIGDRRIFGRDQELAKAFLDSLGPRDMGLVLVDSARRGGAGGVGHFWPAWSSIASEPGETWQDVTLHEMGHSFGLGDEYEEASETVPEPNPLEPNIAKRTGALPTRWKRLVNAPKPAPTSSLPVPPGGWPAGTVGTFMGARYRADRVRPAPSCRMRVATDQFCPVCCDLIAAQLR